MRSRKRHTRYRNAEFDASILGCLKAAHSALKERPLAYLLIAVVIVLVGELVLRATYDVVMRPSARMTEEALRGLDGSEGPILPQGPMNSLSLTIGIAIPVASQPTPSWVVELRDAQGNITEVSNKVEAEAEGLTVSITVRPDEADPRLSCWRIAVDNRSQRWGIWTVTFPILRGLATSKDAYCVWPRGVGRMIKDPLAADGTYWGVYPSSGATMQFAAVGKPGKYLYLATHDPEARVKEFYFETKQDDSATWRVVHFPDHMGEIGRDFALPYDVVIGELDGDWIDACKVYRNWATSQDFCPPPLAEQDNLPQWFKDIAVWLHVNGPSGESDTKQMLEFVKFLDAPVAAHWYNWHQFPFDNGYPEYFPAKPGAAQWAARLQATGIRMVPYINGLLWDVNSKSWLAEDATQAVTMRPVILGEEPKRSYCAGQGQGDPYIRHFGKCDFGIMCTATQQWQDKLAGLCRRIVTELSADGVYLDMTGIFEPSLCFNAGHSDGTANPLYAIRGNQEIVHRCKEAMRAVNPDTILATEGQAEPYSFDAFLSFFDTYFGPNLVPMFEYVYSGYKVSYGRMAPRSKDAFPQQFAQCFVWGVQMGWDGIWQEATLSREPGGRYLKELAHAYTDEAKRFTRYGEMLRPARVLNEVPCETAMWREPVTMPVVLHSLWRAPDGALGLVLTNWGAKPQIIELEVPQADNRRLTVDMASYSAQVVEIK